MSSSSESEEVVKESRKKDKKKKNKAHGDNKSHLSQMLLAANSLSKKNLLQKVLGDPVDKLTSKLSSKVAKKVKVSKSYRSSEDISDSEDASKHVHTKKTKKNLQDRNEHPSKLNTSEALADDENSSDSSEQQNKQVNENNFNNSSDSEQEMSLKKRKRNVKEQQIVNGALKKRSKKEYSSSESEKNIKMKKHKLSPLKYSQIDESKFEKSKKFTPAQNVLDAFVTENNLDKPTGTPEWFLPKFTSDDDIFLVQIPKNLHVQLLTDSLVSLDGQTKFKIENDVFVWKASQENELSLNIMAPSSGDKYMLTNLKSKGNVIVQQQFKTKHHPVTLESVQGTIDVPENLRDRHPLFGSSYKEKINLDEKVLKNLTVNCKKKRKNKEIESDISVENHSLSKKKRKRSKSIGDSSKEMQKSDVHNSLLVDNLDIIKLLNEHTKDRDESFSQGNETVKKHKKKKRNKDVNELENNSESSLDIGMLLNGDLLQANTSKHKKKKRSNVLNDSRNKSINSNLTISKLFNEGSVQDGDTPHKEKKKKKHSKEFSINHDQIKNKKQSSFDDNFDILKLINESISENYEKNSLTENTSKSKVKKKQNCSGIQEFISENEYLNEGNKYKKKKDKKNKFIINSTMLSPNSTVYEPDESIIFKEVKKKRHKRENSEEFSNIIDSLVKEVDSNKNKEKKKHKHKHGMEELNVSQDAEKKRKKKHSHMD